MTTKFSGGLEVTAEITPEFAKILTPEAMAFAAKLIRHAIPKREELLNKRKERQAKIDSGVLPDFLPETKSVREGSWKVAPTPPDLQNRRVEITGPASDAKMVINALNSGANVYMTDFEDSQSPSWKNMSGIL